MVTGDSKQIVSNQDGMHEKLAEIVHRHLNSQFKKPIQQHTQQAFDRLVERVEQHSGNIILDACCGVGESTFNLARQHPDKLIVGVDKSEHRLEKHEQAYVADNMILVRADLNDLYRLLEKQNWPIEKQCIFYPNPWPKAKHIQRRWHGSAVFPSLIGVAKSLELRSNWPIYLQEFQFALQLSGIESDIKTLDVQQPITPFERKYQASGQALYQLTTRPR